MKKLKALFFRLTHQKSMIKVMQDMGIQDLEPYLVSKWKNGYAFFIGLFEGKKVFIKWDTNLNLLSNDLATYQLASPKLKKSELFTLLLGVSFKSR